MDRQVSRKFGMVMCLDSPDLGSADKIFCFYKFNMVANCHVENIKNMISSKSFAPILAEC